MATNSDFLRNHIANMLRFLSGAASYWYTLNTSYDHCCHLSKRLNVSPDEYESLLISANLAHCPKSGFTIKPKEWRRFLLGHHFTIAEGSNECNIEIDKKQINFDALINGLPPTQNNRCWAYVIRIGVLSKTSPTKIELQKDHNGYMIPTPRLNGLWKKQQSIRNSIMPLIWNNILENDRFNDEDNTSIIKKHDHQMFSPPSTSTILSTTYREFEKETSTPVQVPKSNGIIISPDNSFLTEKYPHLSHLFGQDDGGFNPNDVGTKRKMQSILDELVDLLSTEYELKVTSSNNVSLSFVRVPNTSSDRSFQNSKEWLDCAINISGSKQNDTFKSAYRIANHLARFYKDSVLAALETQQIPVCKPMSATEFQAMVTAGKINGTGERELKKHLQAHLGKGFCPTRRSVHMLSEGHGAIQCGTIEYTYPGKEKAETVVWTEKRIDKEIARYLQRHLLSKKVKPSDIKYVQVVAGGDHGDTAFQFGAAVSVELNNGKTLDFEVLVCEVICRKDTGPLLESTILPTLTAGLKIVSDTPIHIYEDSNQELCVKFEPPTTPDSITSKTLKVDTYITGDLAFQAMVLGKESMASHWCMLCKEHKDNFLTKTCKMWTMEELVTAGEAAKNTKGDPELGIKQEPWWPFIPLDNYIVPLLHCEIGVGNQLLDKVRDIVNEYLENMTPQEMQIRASIPILQNIIAATAKSRDEWDTCPNGGRRMNILTRTIAANLRKQGYYQTEIERQRVNVEDLTAKIQELKTCRDNAECEFVALRAFRDQVAEKIKKARKQLTDQQNKLKDIRRAKVKKPDSIETKMFKVLKEIGVELSAYHGGSLNGKDIKKVMNNASYVFNEFAAIFKEGKRQNCQLTDDNIDSLCLHFREVFVLWDGAFSVARTEYPTNDDFERYRENVDAAVQGSKELGCTVTPKVHMMAKHVEWQMRTLRGGLGDKVEDWVERLHQTGIRLRLRFRTVKNQFVCAVARDKAHYRSMHPDVISHIDAINEGSKRNLEKRKIDPVEVQRKRQRIEGRIEAMQYFNENNGIKLTWMAILFDSANVGGAGAAGGIRNSDAAVIDQKMNIEFGGGVSWN